MEEWASWEEMQAGAAMDSANSKDQLMGREETEAEQVKRSKKRPPIKTQEIKVEVNIVDV